MTDNFFFPGAKTWPKRFQGGRTLLKWSLDGNAVNGQYISPCIHAGAKCMHGSVSHSLMMDS